jgi:hypothetical protein
MRRLALCALTFCALTLILSHPALARVLCEIDGPQYLAWKRESRIKMKQWTESVIEHAQKDIGVREIPAGSNDGPRVRQMLASVDLGPGNPYCAAGSYLWAEEVSDKSGVTNPLPKTGYCPLVQRAAKNLKILSTVPTVGSQFLLISSPEGYKRAAHTGWVIGKTKTHIITVEPNTNLDGSREGNGVYRKERPFSSRLQYVLWDKVAPEIAGVVSPLPVKPAPTVGPPAFSLTPGVGYHLILSGREIGIAPTWNGRALFPVREWCEKLGVSCEWNQELQMVEIQDKEAPVDLYKFGGIAWAPMRQLVKFSGLKLAVDSRSRRLAVSR